MPFLVAVVDPAEWNEYDIEQAIHIGHILWSCKHDQSIQHCKRRHKDPSLCNRELKRLMQQLLTCTQEVAEPPKSKNTQRVCDLHI
jgi:hypothetical protein